jgi:hypothetical protein
MFSLGAEVTAGGGILGLFYCLILPGPASLTLQTKGRRLTKYLKKVLFYLNDIFIENSDGYHVQFFSTLTMEFLHLQFFK